jgi:hypothetical protein
LLVLIGMSKIPPGAPAPACLARTVVIIPPEVGSPAYKNLLETAASVSGEFPVVANGEPLILASAPVVTVKADMEPGREVFAAKRRALGWVVVVDDDPHPETETSSTQPRNSRIPLFTPGSPDFCAADSAGSTRTRVQPTIAHAPCA